MNSAVKLLCASSVVAAAIGASLAHLRPEDQQAAWDGARLLLGSAETRSPARAAARVEAMPRIEAAAQSAPQGSASIRQNAVGQYETLVEIDGQSVPMMVDTGATLVVLSFEDADRLGIRPSPSEFNQSVSTANGRAAVARVTLRQMRLGSIVVRDVPALVASRHALGSSLLGMTFLGRLRSVRVEDGRLALQQ